MPFAVSILVSIPPGVDIVSFLPDFPHAVNSKMHAVIIPFNFFMIY